MNTEIIKIDPNYPEMDKIVKCSRIIRDGGLVVFPTETVYGIAADFSNEKAMDRLRSIKSRKDKPFSILISQRSIIPNFTTYNDKKLYKMIDRYWPGPFTAVVPALKSEETIGIRMPNNIIALSLVHESQCTIAAPSANLEGNAPPKTCEEALKDLDGLVDVAIDGGPVVVGKASSVVDFTQEKPVVLREGPISQEEVDLVTQTKNILFVCTGNSCRSVMAEYLLRDNLKEREDVEVQSAGTCVFFKTSASSETVDVLKSQNIDALGHQSQPLTSILLKKADLVFVMTKMHRQQILERVPEVEKRVYLLREFANIPKGFENSLEIPDPVGKPKEIYEQCMLTIQEAIDKIVDLI